jgi:hypothetical protein
MTRAGFAIAAIVLSATVAIALQEEYCSSAQAQTQTGSPEPTIWNHNGSEMYLVANGSSREVYYQKPRQGMLDAGARPGSLLFRGEVTTDNIWELHIFLISIADQFHSKLRGRFSTTMNGSC